MAWIRETFVSRARKKIDSALAELEQDEKKVQDALNAMSREEWEDFIKDMEQLLGEKNKHNMTMVGDQWDEIQWNRLNKIRIALGLAEVGSPYTVHHV